MKRFVLSVGMLAAVGAYAQNTGIGTTKPDASAQLDITSTDKGVLFPRIALTARNVAAPINNPATGLKIYNTATASTANTMVTPGFYYWDGTQWIRENEGELVRKIDETDNAKIGYTLRAIRDYTGTASGGINGVVGINNVGRGAIDFVTSRGTNLEQSGATYTFESGDVGATGDNSFAWGIENLAAGKGSTVWGQNNRAYGENLTVWGGGESFSFAGTSRQSNGYIESGNIVNGGRSTVWGSGNKVYSEYSTISGLFNLIGTETDYETGLFVFGSNNKTSNIGFNFYNPKHTFVLGSNNILNNIQDSGDGQSNIVMGDNNKINYDVSWVNNGQNNNILIGHGINVSNDAKYSINIGVYPTENKGKPYNPSSKNIYDRLFNVGNGWWYSTTNDNYNYVNGYSDAFTILKNGQVGIGYDNFEKRATEDINNSTLDDTKQTRIDINGVVNLAAQTITEGATGCLPGNIGFGSDGNFYGCVGVPSPDATTGVPASNGTWKKLNN